jgi:signal transduction histidine kinase
MIGAMALQIAGTSDEETLRAAGTRTDITSMRPPTLTRASLARSAPFAVVAAVGQISAGWPPGPGNYGAFWVSTALLLALAVAILVRRRVEPSTLLIRASVYIASVILLMIATGGVSSGLGSLLLIPVVGVALYGRRWESSCVVALVLAAVLCVSLTTPDLATATGRRLLLFGSIAIMFSVAIHALRDRLHLSNERTRRLLCQEKSINDAARQLTMMVDPPAIIELGVQLAARMASPAGSEVRRASYLVIEDDVVRVEAQFDESGFELSGTWPLEDHPPLAQSARTGQPVVDRLAAEDVGPTLRSLICPAGITHGAWVPVCPDGNLHGVLTISTRGVPVPAECVERCEALGHLMELALSNWAAHQKLEQQATAEERRRIARELHDGLAHELAFIASKTHRSTQGEGSLDIRQLADAADRALDEARRAISVLSAARPQSLASAVAQTAEDLGARLDLAVRLDLRDDIEIPGEVTENLLRILREAMTNAAKHGASRQVTVRLEHADGVRLVVEDDGCGFDLEGAAHSTGFGLLSMRERAESIGGLLNLESTPAHGTRVEVAVP